MLAENTAAGVDISDVHLQRFLFRFAQKRRWSHNRKHSTDLDFGMRRRARHQHNRRGYGKLAHAPSLFVFAATTYLTRQNLV